MKRLLPIGLLALAVVGCTPRFKGGESFVSSTVPNEASAGWKGDAYSDGGYANPSGGLKPGTRYGAGANPEGQPLPGYDQPAKGSGLQPGEVPPSNAPWWAQQNAPVWQTAPGNENAKGTRVPQ